MAFKICFRVSITSSFISIAYVVSRILHTRGRTCDLTTWYSIWVNIVLILLKARCWSFGTPHSRDLQSKGKKTSPNSFWLTKLTISSLFFKSIYSDYAGSSLWLHKWMMEGQTLSLNCDDVIAFLVSSWEITIGNTWTLSGVSFSIDFIRRGRIFSILSFISNRSITLTSPPRN